MKIFTAKEAKKLADKTVKEGEELTHDKDPWVVSWKSRITHAISDSSKKKEISLHLEDYIHTVQRRGVDWMPHSMVREFWF